MKVVMWIIVAAVFLGVGAFALFNSGLGGGEVPMVTFQFFGEHQVALSLFALACFVAGVFIVGLFALSEEIILRGRIRRLERKLEAMKKELNALRNLPLAAEILTRDAEDEEEK